MPNYNEPGGDRSSHNNGRAFRVPPRTWIVWITILGGIIWLMLMRERWDSQGEFLPQWRFQQLLESNLIAQATVNYSPQNSLLTEIVGKHYVPDKDGNPIKGKHGKPKEVLFHTKARLSPALEEQLFSKIQFEPREPNTMLMSIFWSVLPIVVIAVLIWFFFIRQIRRVSRNSPSSVDLQARTSAQQDRLDQILDKWEDQAKRMDAVLDRMEKR